MVIVWEVSVIAEADEKETVLTIKIFILSSSLIRIAISLLVILSEAYG